MLYTTGCWVGAVMMPIVALGNRSRGCTDRLCRESLIEVLHTRCADLIQCELTVVEEHAWSRKDEGYEQGGREAGTLGRYYGNHTFESMPRSNQKTTAGRKKRLRRPGIRPLSPSSESADSTPVVQSIHQLPVLAPQSSTEALRDAVRCTHRTGGVNASRQAQIDAHDLPQLGSTTLFSTKGMEQYDK